MQAQLAADQENSTIQTFVRTAAHSATRSLHTASEGRRMYRTHQSLCLSHHSSASKQKQVHQTARRTFFVRKNIGRNKCFRTVSPVDTIRLPTMDTCVDRHGAYLALAKMPGCTALIPPIKGHRDQCALYNMCEEACLFPGAFTQAEISLRTHTHNFDRNEEPQKYDAHYSPWGILDHCNSNYMDCPLWLRNTLIPAPCENKGPNESIEELFKPF